MNFDKLKVKESISGEKNCELYQLTDYAVKVKLPQKERWAAGSLTFNGA